MTGQKQEHYSAVIFWSDKDGMFVGLAPDLKISAFGITRSEAARELDVAIALAIETYEAEGWQLPKEEYER